MKDKYVQLFRLKHNLRLHMFLIVTCSFFCGILLNYLLYKTGVSLIWVRLLFSIPFSYGMFFIFTKFWIYLTTPEQKKIKTESTADSLNQNSLDLLDIPNVTVPVDVSSKAWKGTGGNFSGGGASGQWGIPDVDLDIDADSDSAPLVLLILAVIILTIVFGSVFYLVYVSPQLLGEIALENAISIGIIKNAKKSQTPWHEMLLKKTIIPFVVILALSVGTTFAIQKYLPHVTQISELKMSDFKTKK